MRERHNQRIRAGQLTSQFGPAAGHAAGPPDRRRRRAGRRPPCSPRWRRGPGQVAGDAADDEDREHREQRPDAAANAQRPTAHRVGPCHGARAGEHEEPERQVGRAERGQPVPAAGPPSRLARSAAVNRVNRTTVATAAAAAPGDEQPGPPEGGHGPGAQGIGAGARTAGTVTAPATPGEPRTAAVLPDRKCFFAGQVGLGERPLLGQVRARASSVAAGPGEPSGALGPAADEAASASQTGAARRAAGPGPAGAVPVWAAIRAASSSRVGPSGTGGRQPSA